MLQPLWKTVWMLLKKFKIETPYNPEILVLGIHPKKANTLIQNDAYTAALCTLAKIRRQPKCPPTDK